MQQLLTKLVDEQWCFYGQNYCGLDYSDWNMHLNLCCAWNSIEVAELIFETYKFVFDADLPENYTLDQFSIAMRTFSTMEAVSNCVDAHMSKNVRKSRGAFKTSVYERKIKLMYCMVWFYVKNVQNCTFEACQEFLVSKVFEKKFGELKFEELYNKFVVEVVQDLTYKYERKRKVSSLKRVRQEPEEPEEADSPRPTSRARSTSHVHSDALVSQANPVDFQADALLFQPDALVSQPDALVFQPDGLNSQPDDIGFDSDQDADDLLYSWLNPIGVTDSLDLPKVNGDSVHFHLNSESDGSDSEPDGSDSESDGNKYDC